MKLPTHPPLSPALALVAASLVAACTSTLDFQATSTTERSARANRPGSARFANTHETRYIEVDALRADRREALRTRGLWVTKAEAEALGVDTDTVQEGTADPASGRVVKTGEGESEKYYLPPQPMKRHMHARRPGSQRFVSGSSRFKPAVEAAPEPAGKPAEDPAEE